MSKKSYNACGVPWYSNSNTPAIRARPLPELSQETVNSRAAQMQAKIYVVRWIRENWNAGERFVLNEPTQYKLALEGNQNLAYTTWTGEFLECKYSGINYMVNVKLDEGQKRKSGPRFGAFLFYHFAEKVS